MHDHFRRTILSNLMANGQSKTDSDELNKTLISGLGVSDAVYTYGRGTQVQMQTILTEALQPGRNRESALEVINSINKGANF